MATTSTPIITIIGVGIPISITEWDGDGAVIILGTILGTTHGTATAGVRHITAVGTAHGIAVGTRLGIMADTTHRGTHLGIMDMAVSTTRGITDTAAGTAADITAVITTDIIPV